MAYSTEMVINNHFVEYEMFQSIGQLSAYPNFDVDFI
jgi:hypothetical protein